MSNFPSHNKHLAALKRIEGQIRGIQNMIQEERYCVKILNQIQAVIGGLLSIESKMLQAHIETCVTNALLGKSTIEKKEKIEEVLHLLNRKVRRG